MKQSTDCGNGSGWMVQILPTCDHVEFLISREQTLYESPTRQCGDCSDPTYQLRANAYESPTRQCGDCSDPVYQPRPNAYESPTSGLFTASQPVRLGRRAHGAELAFEFGSPLCVGGRI